MAGDDQDSAPTRLDPVEPESTKPACPDPVNVESHTAHTVSGRPETFPVK
jgi:hypothetical protein